MFQPSDSFFFSSSFFDQNPCFSGISENSRHLLKVVIFLEEHLREMNPVNCGVFPTVPYVLSLEDYVSKPEIFQHSCGTYCSLIYAKEKKPQNQVYYYHCYSPSCSWEVGRKEKNSMASVLKQLTGFS